MGLDVYLYDGPTDEEDYKKGQVEIDSAKYPEHLFKIGYWRSSYNDGGFNNVMTQAGLPDLYDIVNPTKDIYEFTPTWQSVRSNATNALAQLDAYLITSVAKYDCFDVAHNPFAASQVKNAGQALTVFQEQVKTRRNSDSSAYGNREGQFHPHGVKAVAFIPGFDPLKAPCVYVVYENGEKDDKWGWYRQALEIVIETIDYVLVQPNPYAFTLHWSS